MDFTDKKLKNYIDKYSSKQNELLAELEKETFLCQTTPRMLSGHQQGLLLKMISCMIKPLNILELGTYTAYSALCLAEGLKINGCLHTIEINDELESFITKFLQKSELNSKIKLHIGDAMKIVPEICCKFDLVFIDADKRLYPEYYKLIFPKINIGGYILADNVLWSGKVLSTPEKNDIQTQALIEFNNLVVKDNRVENIILPFRDGLSLIRKIRD